MSEEQGGGPSEFADRMLAAMNEAALALMVSVGHRTGLFDVMAAMPGRRAPRSHPAPRSTSGTSGNGWRR